MSRQPARIGRASGRCGSSAASAHPYTDSCPRLCYIFSIPPRSPVTDQRRSDRIRSAAGVWPVQGPASDRRGRARSGVPHLRADARSPGRGQGLSSRRHSRAGAGAGRRAGARRRSGAVPSVDCRADRRRRRGYGRVSRGRIRRGRVARRRRCGTTPPPSFDTMLRIVGQLAEAVDAARAAGVGHGALHPRDIFVTPDEARASGFGVVDALERVGLRAPVRRPYSAPERIAGAEWSTPADVFSLGAIAFELLTGRRPSGTGDGHRSAHRCDGAGRRAAPGRARAGDGTRILRSGSRPGSRWPTRLPLAGAPPVTSRRRSPKTKTTWNRRPSLRTRRRSSIQMIALPAEPPVFADEDGPGTTPRRHASALRRRAVRRNRCRRRQPEPDDIVAERDEDEAHWALTRDEDAALASGTATLAISRPRSTRLTTSRRRPTR